MLFRSVYDFHRYEQVALSLQPAVIIFSDVGPGVRWCGNESGSLGETNWNTFDTTGYGRGATGPPGAMLNQGVENGPLWMPAEADVSIRPGWFYHENENQKVKTPQQLFEIYYKTVGRGGNLLLNVPPDNNGLITAFDSASAMGLKQMIDSAFKDNLAQHATLRIVSEQNNASARKLNDGKRDSYFVTKNSSSELIAELDFKNPVTFNNIVLQELIEKGQRIKSFSVEVWNGSMFEEIFKGTTIGYKRIIPIESKTTDKIRIKFSSARDVAVISEIQIYNSPYKVELK